MEWNGTCGGKKNGGEVVVNSLNKEDPNLFAGSKGYYLHFNKYTKGYSGIGLLTVNCRKSRHLLLLYQITGICTCMNNKL